MAKQSSAMFRRAYSSSGMVTLGVLPVKIRSLLKMVS